MHVKDEYSVLIVEDSTAAAVFLDMQLQDPSITTSIVDTATKAIEYLKKNSVDLILLDKNLADGQSGKAVLRYVNQRKEEAAEPSFLPMVVTVSSENFYESGVLLCLGKEGVGRELAGKTPKAFVDILYNLAYSRSCKSRSEVLCGVRKVGAPALSLP